MVKKLKVDLIPAIKRLEILTKGMLGKGMFSGSYRSGFRGKGLEFADYRPYVFGDDALLIDWKATLRTDKILVKEYEEERNLNVFILFDVSDSMIFGSLPKLKFEYSAEMIASLSHAILESGDNIGFALFTDKLINLVRPNLGMRQFYLLSKVLVDPRLYGGPFDFCKVIDDLLLYLPRDSILIIVSDFIGLRNDWKKKIQLIGRKYKVVAVMVRDPRDRTLPDMGGQKVNIEDPYTGRQMTLDVDLLKYAYEAEVRKQEKEIEDEFEKNQCGFVFLTTDKSFVKPLINFFRRRGKGW